MGKFDTSQYNAFWSQEGVKVATAILQDPDIIHSNHTFWSEKFDVNPTPLPTDEFGRATFRAECRQIENGVLMDLRAPLGDSVPEEQGNGSFYTGSLVDFIAKGYVETAQERRYRKKLYSQIEDADIQLVKSYIIPYYQRSLDSANMTLSNMAAQIMSTGKIIYRYGQGSGVNIIKANIPKDNFLKAGAVIWSDTENCKLLDQWEQMMQDVNDKFGVSWQWQLEITRDQFKNYVRKNKQIREHVRWINNVNGIMPPTEERVTDDMVINALKQYSGIPEIVIVEEKQKDVYGGIVHGWDENNAVMRPLGKAGKVFYTDILDESLYKEYGSKSISRSFASAMNNMGRFMHTDLDNGNLKEWHIDYMQSAVPALTEQDYHFIIATNQANA